MPELPPPEFFAEIYRRHGHRCPMSTLGGRLGWAARRHLPPALAGEGVRAVYEIDTCALDGVRAATGCSEESGTLEVRPAGRHRLLLGNPDAGRGVAVELLPAALAVAGRYRAAEMALERERAALDAGQLAERQRVNAALLDEVLECLRRLPEAEVVNVVPLSATPEGEGACR